MSLDFNAFGFTADLRRRLFGVLHLHPGGGSRPYLPLRIASVAMKVGHTTLLRFLDGAAINSDTLDQIYEYVRQQESLRRSA